MRILNHHQSICSALVVSFFALFLGSKALASPGYPPVINRLVVTSSEVLDPNLANNVALDVNDSPPGVDAIRLFKDALTPNVTVSEQLTWRIHGVVDFAHDLIEPKIIDILPPEQTFVPNSIEATINEQPAGAMVELGPGGFAMTFDVLPAGSRFSITFKTVLNIGYDSRETINRARVEISPLFPLSEEAMARSFINAEPVFDCATLIGRVFNDGNDDGYPDFGEKGIAGTRLVALAQNTALTISVDAEGRYHVPCSAIPVANRGSNFIVKLDTRTLPSGFELTTENPRVVRQTRGKVAKADFGVHLPRVIRMDLNDSAFAHENLLNSQATRRGLNQIIDLLKVRSSTLYVSYHAPNVNDVLVKQRMQAVERKIEALWQSVGAPYDLKIETEVIRPIQGN